MITLKSLGNYVFATVCSILLTTPMVSLGQLSINSSGAAVIVDFDNTLTGVSNGQFTGAGLAPAPGAGELDSDSWEVTGFSDGSLSFGGTNTAGDHARGTSGGGVTTGGLYAFDVSGAGDHAIGVQPGGSDWTPGTITLRILNNTGSAITSFDIDYEIHLLNNADRSNFLNFSWSTDNTSYTAVGALDFTSTAAADASPAWASTNRSTSISSLSIADGAYFYIRWTGDDVGGSGSRDEFAIDDITVTGYSNSNTISTGAISGSPFCVTSGAGAAVDVDFISTGTFNAGNNYAAELSDAAGDFTSPTSIGTLASTANSGTISATLPTGTASGSGYRIRVVSDDPVATGSDNGTDLEIILAPLNVTGASSIPGNAQVDVSWTNPSVSSCFDEILVVAKETGSVTNLPSGDGSAYTASATFGSGTDIGGNEYVVYKGTGTAVTATGLTNGTQYCFKIFTRYGTEWSSGVEECATPNNPTVLDRGDLAILGINANNNTCSGVTGEDEISFVCFVDITGSTTLDFTDNGWERQNANQWGNTEGTVRATRTGGTIAAGTVITFRIDNSGVVTSISPDANWSFADLSANFNMNSGGDQIYFMQGGTWNNGTPGSHDATYSGGNVLFGFTTNGTWSADGGTQHSNLYPFTDCFTMAPTGSTDFSKYTGPTTSASQRTWISRINNSGNWTSYGDCGTYSGASPDYAGGFSIAISSTGWTDGFWEGATSTDWFDCSNWQDLEIPNSTTNVTIPTVGVTNEPTIAVAGAECAGIKIQTSRTLTINGTGTLDIYSNFDNDGTFTHAAGTVTFTSGNASSIIGTNTIDFYNLVVDKSASGITLSRDVEVTNSLTLTRSIVSTGTNFLILKNTSAGSLSGHSGLSFINGNLRRFVDNGGANSDIYAFPVGDGTTPSDYHLAEVINGNLTGGGFTYLDASFNPLANHTDGDLVTTEEGTPYNSVCGDGVWYIEPDNQPAGGDYDVRLYFGNFACGLADNQFGILKRSLVSTTAADWACTPCGFGDPGINANGGLGRMVADGYALRLGLSSFSQFGIGLSGEPLPIELLNFTADYTGKTVELNWTTATEINNDFFTIEKTTDGENFTVVDRVDGAGTISFTKHYTTIDPDPSKGVNYYRLKQTDYDGTSKNSDLVAINVPEYEGFSVLTTIPKENELQIEISGKGKMSIQIEIVDILGRKVFHTISSVSENGKLIIPTHPIQDGLYFIRVSDGRQTIVKKILL